MIQHGARSTCSPLATRRIKSFFKGGKLCIAIGAVRQRLVVVVGLVVFVAGNSPLVRRFVNVNMYCTIS